MIATFVVILRKHLKTMKELLSTSVPTENNGVFKVTTQDQQDKIHGDDCSCPIAVLGNTVEVTENKAYATIMATGCSEAYGVNVTVIEGKKVLASCVEAEEHVYEEL